MKQFICIILLSSFATALFAEVEPIRMAPTRPAAQPNPSVASDPKAPSKTSAGAIKKHFKKHSKKHHLKKGAAKPNHSL